MITPLFIGIRGIGCSLAEHFIPLECLPLHSSPEVMAGFGFTGAVVTDEVDTLVLNSARHALVEAATEPSEIQSLFYASALSGGHVRASATPRGNLLDSFCYRGSWLQDALALDAATVSGIAQQGCAGMFTALRQARSAILAEPEIENVLCVGADAFGPDSEREVLYNVLSDAACAVVLSRNRGWARWLGFAQITKGYYWDVAEREAELIASYFPTARIVIRDALAKAGLSVEDVDVVIPTGVNPASWPILLRLCGLREDALYCPKARFGHTIAADSFIYLQEAREGGYLSPGMRILLFTYGFGSTWSALVLEVTEDASQ